MAAGHPLTAQAGARVLREGGNAVDAAVAAMLTSFVAEPLLTGLGAGGYMLVAGGGRSPRCSTSSCRRRPTRERRATPRARCGARGDRRLLRRRRAGLSHRPGLLRRVRHAGRRLRGGQEVGDDCARAARGAGGRASHATACSERRSGLRGEDPRRPAALHARVRGAVGAGGTRPARGRAAAQSGAGRRAGPAWAGWRRALLPRGRRGGGMRVAAARAVAR